MTFMKAGAILVAAVGAWQGGAQRADTATVRMHISGMTCGSCPTTARLALRRVDGVYDAKVTLDDSLGIVQYNPKRVTPQRIADDLTRLTGYGAKLLPDTSRAPRRSGR
jgi:copper chaperone CopZ